MVPQGGVSVKKIKFEIIAPSPVFTSYGLGENTPRSKSGWENIFFKVKNTHFPHYTCKMANLSNIYDVSFRLEKLT